MKWLDPSVTHWDDKRGYWDDKKKRLPGWQERSSRMTPHHVIPARDGGIQPFIIIKMLYFNIKRLLLGFPT
ncbi:hypothetical protein H9I48_00175 [Wolbachia pipientis]|uniref:hypothetical protein n=1 Tax=Wolbachia pipientis TaxID=955 RepID=UPI00165129D6|nr:hypothetical protein [Wolbachia pipientis]MBC6685690.1 hypothetical protein [Wolbachia pipientis]